MTDLRKIPWRLPAGYEDLKPFWDEFIKKLGESFDSLTPEVPLISCLLADSDLVDASTVLYRADNQCGALSGVLASTTLYTADNTTLTADNLAS